MATEYGTMTSDGVALSDLYKEFVAALKLYRQAPFPYMDTLARFVPLGKDTKEYLRSFEMQNLAEHGTPDQQRLQTGTISAPTALPYGLANAYELDAIEESRADDLRQVLAGMVEADQEKMIQLLISTMMTKGSDGFYDGAMAVAPPRYGTNVFTTGENHYLTSGGATIALDDLTTIKQTIRKHGVKENLLLFINSAEQKAFEDLAGFTTAMTHVPLHDAIVSKGFDAVGYVLGFTIVQTEWCPAGYLLATVSAQNRFKKPVVYSEPETKNLHGQSVAKGLHLMPGKSEDPLIGAKYRHRIGMKVFCRDAGAVMKITAGAWSNPTI